MTRTKNIKRRAAAQEKRKEEAIMRKREEKERMAALVKKKAQRQEDKKTNMWEKRYRPQVGDTILYIERGKICGKMGERPYVNHFLGLVTYSKIHRNGNFEFEIRTEKYKNHKKEGCVGAQRNVREENEGKTQYIRFTKEDLDSSEGKSVFYTDAFAKHLKSDHDYGILLMKSYAAAKKHRVFPCKSCRYGPRCQNKKIGHLINFTH